VVLSDLDVGFSIHDEPVVPSPIGSITTLLKGRILMEGNIAHWTYWLGMVSLVIALLWRAFNALGLWLPMYIREGETVHYMSFYKASLLFFVAAIASSNYAAFKSQKH
jgi:hypothetical protein